MGIRRKLTSMLILLFICLRPYSITGFAEAKLKIEQVTVNMPEVVTYYRCDDGAVPEAYLGGKALKLQEHCLFEETGEAIEYYVLLDVSASIPREARFREIKESLIQFLSEMRPSDQLILVTFGDQVTTVLDGAQDRDTAIAKIQELTNKDQNTVLFHAIDQVANMITQETDLLQKRRVMVIISDGKDCADNTQSMSSIEQRLTADGIPVYTIAVENNEGDTKDEIADYQGKFSALSRNTGGIPWVIKNDKNTFDGLIQMRDTLFDSYRAGFLAESNRVSNQKEDFTLKLPGRENLTDTVSVLVSRWQADDSKPEAKAKKGEEKNEIYVTFSEAVEKADQVSNYRVKRKEKTIPVSQVIKDNQNENTYVLIFAEDLRRGSYTIEMSNITDQSQERNSLAESVVELEIQNQIPETETPKSETPTESEEPTETETQIVSETPTEIETEKDTVIVFAKKWWPVLLAIVGILVVLIVCLVIKAKKKSKKETWEEPIEPIMGDNSIPEKIERPDEPEPYSTDAVTVPIVLPEKTIGYREAKQVILWMSNGEQAPQKIEVLMNHPILIGRSKECDISCADNYMGRRHFTLEFENGNFYVTDLHSQNGTSVNGIKINGRYKLERYDEIMAGNIRFRLEW